MGILKGVMELLSLDKWARLARIAGQRGGLKETISTVYRTDDLKEGELVGTDEFGNQYFKNDEYFVPRNRWVIYNKRVYVDYDGAQIPPDWNRWLQHTTDVLPTPDVRDGRRPAWQLRHEENLTGSTRAYTPYSTMRTKVEAWNPAATAAKS